MKDLCTRCGGQVFLHEFPYDSEMKSYQFVCVNCGTVASGITDIEHDLSKSQALFRGNKKDYAKLMKERFNLTVA
jgi:hypothetical protein